MQLYLDCDGVLAAFDEGAHKTLGMDRHQFQALHGRQQYLDKLAAEPNFYGDLRLKSDAMDLFRAVEFLSPVILTGFPEGGEWAVPQKIAWAEKHFPGTVVITVPQERKCDYARLGDILIDDKVENRAGWEAAGGLFFLHTSAADTLNQLKARVPGLFPA